MIYGIGTDIVDASRFESLFARHKDRLAGRILSATEVPQLQGHCDPARFIAKRFAAKEAFAKAVGSGLREPVSLRRISIVHDGLGKPVLTFDPTLRTYLAQLGIGAHFLSISDERHLIVAFVVLESC